MERVAFLLDKTGERLPCLLNPASVIVRRRAGVQSRESNFGPLTGAGLKDDPVLYTGGGMTEILLDLLFDVTILGSTLKTDDVRDLTRPLTALAEGSSAGSPRLGKDVECAWRSGSGGRAIRKLHSQRCSAAIVVAYALFANRRFRSRGQ